MNFLPIDPGNSPQNGASISCMSRRLRLIIIAAGLFLAACTSEGTPGSFPDQDGRVESQFVSACESAQDGEDATEYCQCAFYSAAVEFGFDGFLELDEMLREDPDGLTFDQRQFFESVSLPCEFSAADVPS